MATLNKLSAAAVKNLPEGRHTDGGGLHLFVRPDGSRSWVLRLVVHGRRRDMGLGGFPALTLAAARVESNRWRSIAKAGGDPIKERERLAREAAKACPTLESVFAECFEARKAELKGDGRAGRWDSPLRVHVLPKLGKVPIEEIDQRDVANMLKPIWHDKPDAARKAANRLGIVIKHGAAMGLDVDLQAVEKARALLGKQRHEVQHTPALSWPDVPGFYRSLGEGITELALRFLILTGCRSGEVRGACEDEIDLTSGIWEIPANRMKAGKAHRVPLSAEAIEIVELANRVAQNGFLFPGRQGKGPLSDMVFTQFFKRRDMQVRAHGFRSSLRTWLAEATDAPREVGEMCLAHETGSKVETAYRRSDFLEQRRVLMERWADHVTGGSGTVVSLAVHQ